jgi:hypothetical protein
VSWPAPQPGLVIRYSYLWRRESQVGREEGAKDRPCALVAALQDDEGETRVYVLPISHDRPTEQSEGVELPARVKAHLGLDDERSWVHVNEANVFRWPGPDLRIVPGKGPETLAYGFLPPRGFWTGKYS